LADLAVFHCGIPLGTPDIQLSRFPRSFLGFMPIGIVCGIETWHAALRSICAAALILDPANDLSRGGISFGSVHRAEGLALEF
jgi:hypothetical protein